MVHMSIKFSPAGKGEGDTNKIHTRFQIWLVAELSFVSVSKSRIGNIHQKIQLIHFGYFSFSTIHLELKRQIRL